MDSVLSRQNRHNWGASGVHHTVDKKDPSHYGTDRRPSSGMDAEVPCGWWGPQGWPGCSSSTRTC